MKRFVKIFLFVCFVSATPFVAVQAMMVLQLNLEQLTALSERVFVGKCLEVTPMHDEKGRSVVQVTYAVSETLKGPAQNKVTFRQLSLQEVDQTTGREGVFLDQALPEYKVGEESVVFLSANGSSGLTAPIGFGQGKFEIVALNSGKQVRNAMGNRGLFMHMDNNPKVLKLKNQKVFNPNGDSVSVNEDLDYGDFVSTVRSLSHP
jgi:hypothetical protein